MSQRERQVSTLEQAFDVLRTAGPFTRPELAARAVPGLDTAEVIDTLIRDRRVVELRIAEQDAGRCRGRSATA